MTDIEQAFEAGRQSALADYIALDQTCTDLRIENEQLRAAADAENTDLSAAIIRGDQLFDIAKDLLDACERLLHLAESNTWPGPNTIAQARAAIAKAKGEQP